MHDPRQRPPSPNPEDPGGFGGGSWTTLRWMLVIGLVVAALLFASIAISSPDDHLSISYSQFIQQVEGGNIEHVVFEGQQVTGTFQTEMRVTGGRLLESGRSPAQGDPPVETWSSRDFKTTVPPGAEGDLLQQLRQQNVEIAAKNSDGDSMLPEILLIGVPLLLIIGAMVATQRGSSRVPGQQQLLNFAQSRARLYNSKRPRVKLDDVAGEDEAKAELAQIVDFLRSPRKYHELGAQLPRGVLLIGPPGTGKTLLASAVAGEANVPFISASASEFVEMFVGVGASRVRDLFEKAKNASPAIIFIDEIDAVGRRRGSGMGGNDEREHTLNQLLVEMDGFEPHQDIIVIGATNRPDVLDPALLRPGRFDRRVTLGLPDQRGREAILQVHLRGHPLADGVDAAAIAAATPGFTGADLANLVNEAALVAAQRGKRQVEWVDFSHALDKIILGAERPLLITDEEKRVIAYHEAGHALVAYFTPGGDPLRKISIVPRGRSLGVTVQAPARDRFNYSRAELFGRLAIMMGGRAAEQLVFNEITTGAENDLQEATTLARRMVERWGMSESVGLMFLAGEDSPAFDDGMMRGTWVAGERMLNTANAAVRRLLNEAHSHAEQLLLARRDQLDRLADALIAEETLEGERITHVLRTDVQVRVVASDAAGE